MNINKEARLKELEEKTAINPKEKAVLDALLALKRIQKEFDEVRVRVIAPPVNPLAEKAQKKLDEATKVYDDAEKALAK